MKNFKMSDQVVLKDVTFPKMKGTLSKYYQLSKISWLKVGGPAEFLFKPYDLGDLKNFVTSLCPDIPISILGACSNLLIRDGGIPGVSIKLGRNFNNFEIKKYNIKVGASVPTARLAAMASDEGYDLAFLRTIPGTVGGAVKMNAGCYGRYVSDCLESVEVLGRNGAITEFKKVDLGLSYRISDLPKESIVISATFKKIIRDSKILKNEMQEALRYRANVQPTDELSCGSAFKNPSGASSFGKSDENYKLSAWKLIDEAGCRGIKLGKAKVSEKHPNFLINMGGARASEIEDLGELVREKVYEKHGINLNWEIKLVGKK